MRRGVVMLIAGVAVITSLSVSPVFAASRYPVSVGVSYGKWSPSLDAYNLRFLDQNNPSMVNGTPVYIRQPLDTLTVPITYHGYTTGRVPYLFSSAWGFGINAKVRLHSDLYALFEYDWWKQSVGSERNYGGLIGYEGYEVKLNPVTLSLIYNLPAEIGGTWWPQVYLGVGAGSVLVERTNLQITNAAHSKATSSGSGTILNGLAGMEYVIPVPFFQDRVSLFVEGRYIMGDYTEQFTVLGNTGSALRDTAGKERTEDKAVSVQGPHLKMGLTINFGQLKPRPEKGVLSGLLEPSRRRAGGYAMAPSYGAPASAGGGGVTVIYPQPPEQVQVVQGVGHIDEDRIRQIIREELLSARLSTGAARPVDDLAEQQLRSIRERRLQAEQELQQLKELLREEG